MNQWYVNLTMRIDFLIYLFNRYFYANPSRQKTQMVKYGEKNLEQCLNEIREVIKRMDQRWDLGFITNEQDYIEQRLKLQQELEQLTPIDTNDLEKAVDLLDNFRIYWEACNDDEEAQHDLVKQMVERVYVQGERVVAITLKASCHLVLGYKINEPTAFTVDPFILKKPLLQLFLKWSPAETTGFEPATSALTGPHANRYTTSPNQFT